MNIHVLLFFIYKDASMYTNKYINLDNQSWFSDELYFNKSVFDPYYDKTYAEYRKDNYGKCIVEITGTMMIKSLNKYSSKYEFDLESSYNRNINLRSESHRTISLYGISDKDYIIGSMPRISKNSI